MSEPKAPVWPELADQPAYEWPEALSPSTASPEPAQLAGQMMMSQAAIPAPWIPEPYRDPRKPPAARAIVPVAIVPEMQPERPAGRVLLAIEEPEAGQGEAHRGDRHGGGPTVRVKRARAIRVPEAVAVESVSMPEAADRPTVEANPPAGPGAARLARANFKRGERWKARLPAAIHRADQKLKG